MEAAEDDFCAEQCQHLLKGITSAASQVIVDKDNVIDSPFNQMGEPFPRGPSPLAEEDNNAEPCDATNQQSYSTQRIQEEEAWLKVISPMFIAYMRCKALTLEWGHLTDWDTDWKIDTDGSYPNQHKEKNRLRSATPFMEALEEYLNAANPIITRENSNEPRDWRRPFTAAVDAYRHMLRLESELAIRAMKLNFIDKLAANCPRCSGEHYPNHRKEEPDFIVCMDGNFQQRRHLLASCEPAGLPHTNPALFIHPSQVEAWNPRGQWITEGDGNDVQGSGEKAYFSHAMIDWLLKNLASGSFPDDPRIGILYDIGCNIEKGLICNNLFVEENLRQQLKFGTSVFHSYVHNWGCQLEYNPQLNVGWGLSDGEGCEREWFIGSPLVSQLRYCTSQHRKTSLNLKYDHANRQARRKAGNLILNKLNKAEKTQNELLQILDTFKAVVGLTWENIEVHWARQRQMQLEMIEDERHEEVQDLLEELGDLEDSLAAAKGKQTQLRRKRRRVAIENSELRRLALEIDNIQDDIDVIIQVLGDDRFRELSGASGWDCTASTLPVDLVEQSYHDSWRINRVSKTTWEDCIVVLKSLIKSLSYELCRPVRSWEQVMITLLERTHVYCDTVVQEDIILGERWKWVIESSCERWSKFVCTQTVVGEVDNEEEAAYWANDLDDDQEDEGNHLADKEEVNGSAEDEQVEVNWANIL
ncbi:hypothetical protein DFH28DRAFT_922033 [Melampsora americana]|nr:hypothetical protein DFH28DRAFT_922033 [Melampsora americana]